MDADSLIKRIETAFADVTLGDGVTPAQADALDSYWDSEKKLAAARATDCEKHWTEYTKEDIEVGLHEHCFFDEAGWRHFLPAAMRFVVSRSIESDKGEAWSAIQMVTIQPIVGGYDRNTSKRRRFPQKLRLFESLSEDQSRAVAAFLNHIAAQDVDSSDIEDAKIALARYWHLFLEDSTT
jgi:hypothetical protein